MNRARANYRTGFRISRTGKSGNGLQVTAPAGENRWGLLLCGGVNPQYAADLKHASNVSTGNICPLAYPGPPAGPPPTHLTRTSGPLAGRWGGLGPITCLGSGRGLWTQRRRPGDQAAQGLGADDGRQNYRQNLAAGDGWEASKPAPPGYQALSRAPPRQLRIRLAMLFRWGARPQASLIRAHISTGGVPASASCTASTRTSGG